MNPIARRPWVAAAGAAGFVVVAAAAGYGFGRQAEPVASTPDSGTTVATGTGGTTGGTATPDQGTPPGSGSEQGVDPGQDPFGGQDPFSGQTPSDPSSGFGGQPGTISPGQGSGGATTQSGGS